MRRMANVGLSICEQVSLKGARRQQTTETHRLSMQHMLDWAIHDDWVGSLCHINLQKNTWDVTLQSTQTISNSNLYPALLYRIKYAWWYRIYITWPIKPVVTRWYTLLPGKGPTCPQKDKLKLLTSICTAGSTICIGPFLRVFEAAHCAYIHMH